MSILGEIPFEVDLALLKAKTTNSEPPEFVLEWAKGNDARSNYVFANIQIEVDDSGGRKTGPENRSLSGKNESIRSFVPDKG